MVTRSSMVSEHGFGTVVRQYAHPHRGRQERNATKFAPGAAAGGAGGQARSAAKVRGVIGELREGPLHRALKEWLSAPGDAFEVPVEGYVIDLVRADGELVEVQ